MGDRVSVSSENRCAPVPAYDGPLSANFVGSRYGNATEGGLARASATERTSGLGSGEVRAESTVGVSRGEGVDTPTHPTGPARAR